MLVITATAKEKLREVLQGEAIEPEMAFRIAVTPLDRLAISLDKQSEGDRVVESEEGVKILLIGPEVAAELEGLVFDYKETPLGARFTISKPSPPS